MKEKEFILQVLRAQGRADALGLRERAPELDGTGLIAEEEKIPRFDGGKDYASWPAGAPVWEEVQGQRQVFALLQPHNAAHYPGQSPSTLPALWSVRHTKDPAKAKAWLAPNGTSGLYSQGEACLWEGKAYRSLVDQNAFSPGDYPQNWEEA